MHGGKDDELATRWLQLGVFSPILRLHSSLNIFNSKEPWRFSNEVCPIMMDSLRWRHRLMPYLYTMNVKASRDGEPIVQPMYWSHARSQEAYRVKNQFHFGSELMVMPITSPRDTVTKLGRVRGWFPPGKYVDIFSGTSYAGDREMWLHRPLDEYPVFAPIGSIIPLDAESMPKNGGANPESLEILVVVGKDAAFDLLEDDGTGSTVDEVDLQVTKVRYSHGDRTITLKTASGRPRNWSFRFLGIYEAKVKASSGGVEVDRVEVDRVVNGTLVRLGQLSPSTECKLVLESEPEFAPMDPVARIWPILDGAQLLFDIKARMWEAVISTDPLHIRVSRLQALAEYSPLLVDAVLEYMLADP
jgi:alpha-glucosidase (family GH31 glycosyl hydrolase)